MMHDALRAALLDARVPRYTSYPPANRFAANVGATQAASWLGAVPDGAAVSLYVHVPFCRRLCWFCACRTQGTQSDAPLDRWLDHLALEVAMVRAMLPEGVTVSALHLGGGTPTILSAERLGRLTRLLRGAFDLSGAEISVEIDPCELDGARADALMRLGMSRASIGIQDFDPKVQDAIGRHQSAAQTARVVGMLRARGVASVNFDLLYGLPHQTGARLADTLDTALALRPDRIALFGYAHVPWMARRQRLIPEAALPGAAGRVDLAQAARDRLEGVGYVPVGIDHFAWPGDALARAARGGTLRRNFQGYTTDDAAALIGMGPSAISCLPGGYVQNEAATGPWQAALASGRLPAARGHAMTRADGAVAAVIERLMCDGAADLDTLGLAGAMRDALLARAGEAVAALPGLGRVEGARIEAGPRAVWRLLAARLDPGFRPETARFSQAS